jgi:hypothetical protein
MIEGENLGLFHSTSLARLPAESIQVQLIEASSADSMEKGYYYYETYRGEALATIYVGRS